jgi:hypothetical protein
MTRGWRRTSAGKRTSSRVSTSDRERLDALEARIMHLEVALEGLQDAVYRRDVLHDRDIGELRKRTEPARIARDLSDDARRRGI